MYVGRQGLPPLYGMCLIVPVVPGFVCVGVCINSGPRPSGSHCWSSLHWEGGNMARKREK